jgi:hypothetical protein
VRAYVCVCVCVCVVYGGSSAVGQVSSPITAVFPCQFHSTIAS